MSLALDAQKHRAAQAAAALVEDGMVIGLGTGSTAALVLEALAVRRAAGLRFAGVPSSRQTEALATRLTLPLTSLDEHSLLDLTIDGADEVAPNLEVIKGAGGALLREKVLASASQRLIIVVDSSKLVSRLGSRSPLPVEVTPFALPVVERRLRERDLRPVTRLLDGRHALTDNGNCLVDCQTGQIADPAALSRDLLGLTGVVDHGLFLGLVSEVVVGHADGTVSIHRVGEPAAW